MRRFKPRDFSRLKHSPRQIFPKLTLKFLPKPAITDKNRQKSWVRHENMRCKGPRFQIFFLRSRFYLTGTRREIGRKIPRLPSRVIATRIRVRGSGPHFCVTGATWRHRRAFCAKCTKRHLLCKFCTKCQFDIFCQIDKFVHFDKFDKICQNDTLAKLAVLSRMARTGLKICTIKPILAPQVPGISVRVIFTKFLTFSLP